MFYKVANQKRRDEFIKNLQSEMEITSDTEDEKFSREEAEALMKKINNLFYKPYAIQSYLIITVAILEIIVLLIV
jgi:hypothetical protein